MKIPQVIISILNKFKENGFEAFLVGGCVRDLICGVCPKDWDMASNSKPKDIIKLFPKSFYKNKFGTVTVKTDSKEKTMKEVEITTYRKEIGYSDKRHPDKIEFAKTIVEDLSRRDFTINAMAIGIKNDIATKTIADTKQINSNYLLIDPFDGEKDIKNKIIRSAGKPDKRFSEDALRLLRAIRFASVLGKEWKIEKKTMEAIEKNAKLINFVSPERIKDELIKIIECDMAYEGLILLQKTKLLKYILPEIEKGVGVAQNRHHIYTIFEHSALSLKYAAKCKYNLDVRLAALFHDVAKPQTKHGDGPGATFYNHDVVGANFVKKTLSRLKFSKKTIEKVANLVRCHMFFYDPETVTESSVRRLLKKVGKENIEELVQLRTCDRKGSGVPKARPYRLRHLEYVISKVSRDPICVKMLKINGDEVIKILDIKPGPKVGLILNALLAEILENPKQNNKKYLKKRVLEIGKLSNKKLLKEKEIIREKEDKIEKEQKKKFYIC